MKTKLFFAGTIAFFALVGFICWVFVSYDQAQQLQSIIALLIGAGAAGPAGYTYGRYRQPE